MFKFQRNCFKIWISCNVCFLIVISTFRSARLPKRPNCTFAKPRVTMFTCTPKTSPFDESKLPCLSNRRDLTRAPVYLTLLIGLILGGLQQQTTVIRKESEFTLLSCVSSFDKVIKLYFIYPVVFHIFLKCNQPPLYDLEAFCLGSGLNSIPLSTITLMPWLQWTRWLFLRYSLFTYHWEQVQKQILNVHICSCIFNFSIRILDNIVFQVGNLCCCQSYVLFIYHT